MSGEEAVRHVASGLILMVTGQMGSAVDRLIAQLKTNAQFRKMVMTQPFSMEADVPPSLVTTCEQAIHGLCLSVAVGERQNLLKLIGELKPTKEETEKGWQGGIDAATAILASRMPPSDEAERPPPVVFK